MKNLVRAFALTLVATGAVASLHASNSASTVTVASKVSMPVPSCPPGTADGCGIDKVLGN